MSNKQLINHLAQEIQHFVWQKVGDKTPSVDEFEQFINEHADKFGVSMIKEHVEETKEKIPALLKPSADVSKRMRELAGIPHKDNFV